MSASRAVVPVTRKQVKAFVREHHRHGPTPPAADVLRVGLVVDGQLVAVAMAGTPSAPALMDGVTLEVTRVAVEGYVRNACSQLYGALWRAAQALGWQRMVTYTRTDESGASLRAVGWIPEARLPARTSTGWENRPGRQAADVPVERIRWRVGTPTCAASQEAVRGAS